MKTFRSIALALVLVTALGTLSVSAAHGKGNGTCNNSFVDGNFDGICDNVGTGTGCGSYFVDWDGDGVCDNAGSYVGRNHCGGNGCHR